MDKIDMNWEEMEDLCFQNEVKCYTVFVNKKRYDVIGPIGTMHSIDKKSGKGNGKAIHCVAANPRNFLDNKANTTKVIPYGYWTCSCERGFVRTPYVSICLKCGCFIKHQTNRATYLEDISFVS